MSAMQDKLSALRNKYKAKPKPKPTKVTKMLSRKNTKKSLKPAPKPAAKPSAAKLSYKQHMANLNKGILMDSDSEDLSEDGWRNIDTAAARNSEFAQDEIPEVRDIHYLQHHRKKVEAPAGLVNLQRIANEITKDANEERT